MNVEAYLREHQSPLSTLFINALKSKKWSHAYLLHGYQGQPLKEIGLFLAQSLLCDSPNPLACGQCLTCQRFLNQDYTDLVIIDGSESSIKKQEVINLESRFAITGLEKANKQIYLLHQVEAMTPEAINALLKFLEEPSMEIYALLTTTNLDDVLPTIQSRSQVIHLKPIDQAQLIEEAKKLGVEDRVAEMLSFEFGTAEQILEKSKEPATLEGLNHLQRGCELWMQNPLAALHDFRMEWLATIEDEAQALVMIRRWMVILKELAKVKTKQAVILKSYVKLLTGLTSIITDPYEALRQLQSREARLNKSSNLNLFLDGMMIELLGVSR